jgi:hypothetical protein
MNYCWTQNQCCPPTLHVSAAFYGPTRQMALVYVPVTTREQSGGCHGEATDRREVLQAATGRASAHWTVL